MEQVEVGGLQIAYHRAGSGPPLVLVHGFFNHKVRDFIRHSTS